MCGELGLSTFRNLSTTTVTDDGNEFESLRNLCNLHLLNTEYKQYSVVVDSSIRTIDYTVIMTPPPPHHPQVERRGTKRGPPGPIEGMTEEEKLKAEAQQRSFERSLAGPSVGKAGTLLLISRDQGQAEMYVIIC